LKSKSAESTPGSETDASHAKNGVTDGDGASVNTAEVPREKPAANAPAATPVPDSENTATGAEPARPPAGEAMPGKTATPETDGGGSGATDSPSVQKKPSAEQVEAREGGFILVNNKAWTKAEKQIGQALQTFPDDSILHYLYGRVLANKREMSKAIDELEQAVVLDSTMADAYWELGKIYLTVRKKDKAKAALESFLHLAPNDTQRTPQAQALLKKIQ
jgi:TolA-binding protein